MPDVETIQRNVRRNRLNTCPAVLNVHDIQFTIPQNYTVGILSQQFLASDNGRPDRIILFSRDKGFHFISNSGDCFLGGILKSSTVQIMKTYTVHGLKNNKNIVRVCEMMSNKRRATYVEKLTEIQQLTHKAIPHSLKADFESSMLSALN